MIEKHWTYIKLLWLMCMKSGSEGMRPKSASSRSCQTLTTVMRRYKLHKCGRALVWIIPAAYPSAFSFHLCVKLFPVKDQASANRKSVTLSWYPVLFTALLCFPRACHPFLLSENRYFQGMSSSWPGCLHGYRTSTEHPHGSYQQ